MTEQKAQLTEQKEMLRTTIKMLVKAGLSQQEIAEKLGKDLSEVIYLSE